MENNRINLVSLSGDAGVFASFWMDGAKYEFEFKMLKKPFFMFRLGDAANVIGHRRDLIGKIIDTAEALKNGTKVEFPIAY